MFICTSIWVRGYHNSVQMEEACTITSQIGLSVCLNAEILALRNCMSFVYQDLFKY